MNKKITINLIIIYFLILCSFKLTYNIKINQTNNNEQEIQVDNNKSNIENNNKLLNCPFCDGEANIKYIGDNNEMSVYIECKDCELETNYFRGDIKLAENKAIQYWNGRIE